MKAALTLGFLLAALVAAPAAPSRAQDAPAPDLTVLGFEWKYAGYDRAETVKSNESSVTDGPATLYKIARGTVYVFTDEKEQKVLKRYRLQSKQQILPGETQTVGAGLGLDPKEKTPHIKTGRQSVEVTRIEYADGSAWKKP